MPHQLEYKRVIEEKEQKRIVSQTLYECINCGREYERPEQFQDVDCENPGKNWVIING
jgi:hypothetical protein